MEESDRKTVSTVLDTIEQFIGSIKIDTYLDNNKVINDFNGNDEGIILKVIRPGEIITDYKELEIFLSKENIDYSIVSKISSHAETGASGGESELILFIANTVASGVTWDMLKMGISKIVSPFEEVSIKLFENIQFQRVRKIVSNRSRIDEKELILFDFRVNEDKGLIEIVFKAGRKYIYIRCDMAYNILAYKLSNKKVFLTDKI